VAVYMRQLACKDVGFKCITSYDNGTPVEHDSSTGTRLPKRTLDWISCGGGRAVGAGWSPHPLIPRIGRTETEVACMMNGTPVHRCRLQAASNV
jgi:hypothetical protein